MRCPHCNSYTKTNTGWKIHLALSKKCRRVREEKACALAQEAHSDLESSSSSSSSSSLPSSSSDSPLLPSRNPFFKFLKRNRKDRIPHRQWNYSGSRTSFDSVNTGSSAASTDLPKEPFEEFHPVAADTYGTGKTVMEQIQHSDQYAKQRDRNIYHPFVSKEDWEMAAWLIESGLSMAEIDKFLHLTIVRPAVPRLASRKSLMNSTRYGLQIASQGKLSFSSAQHLHEKIAQLPKPPP